MKKIVLTAILTIGMIVTLQAQNELNRQAQNELNKNALSIKKYAPLRYELIKEFAEQDWKGDHMIMANLINKQADALIEFLLASNNVKYDEVILEKTMAKWTNKSKDGFFIRDYQLIMNEYNQQVEAKTQL